MPIKSCHACNKEFISHNHFGKFCCIPCRNAWFLAQPFICKVHGPLKDEQVVLNYKKEYAGRMCKECKRAIKLRCREKNRVHYNLMSIKDKRTQREALHGWYVRRQLREQIKYHFGDNPVFREVISDRGIFPEELIECKRLHILLLRILKGDASWKTLENLDNFLQIP